MVLPLLVVATAREPTPAAQPFYYSYDTFCAPFATHPSARTHLIIPTLGLILPFAAECAFPGSQPSLHRTAASPAATGRGREMASATNRATMSRAITTGMTALRVRSARKRL